MVDYDKILFSTQYPIDKAVVVDEYTRSVSGPSGAFYYDSNVVDLTDIPNPYGKKCWVRYAWSTDGINYYPPDSILEYAFTIDATAIGGPVSDTINGVRAAAAMGASDDNIYFICYNGYHGNVTYTLGNDIFTGVAQTFYFKYALFEIE